METEIINGRSCIVRHTFPLEELKVGSSWMSSSGSEVEITKIDGEWVYYFDKNNGIFYDKDWFSFQCRYYLIVD